MQFVQNTPVGCRVCGTSTFGKEYPKRDANGNLVMECEWRCGRCGSFVKRGVTKIVEEKKPQ